MTAAALTRPTAAVVGSGVSGLTAAHLLQKTHDVTLFETDGRLGGHAHTHDVPTPDDRIVPIDTGFIVHNERTYPNLLRLFAELGVSTQPTEMSMSISCEGCGLEYAGARGLGGVFAQPRRIADPRFLRMLVEVRRFHRQARRLLELAGPEHRRGEGGVSEFDRLSLGAFLALGGYSDHFVSHFVVPVVSCVWSSAAGLSLQYPAVYLFRFLENHGMLTVSGSPQWRTVTGGSRSYVEKAAKGLTAVQTGAGIRSLTRHADGVELVDGDGQRHAADVVVVATHPDQALTLLADPTDDERATLGCFSYSTNETVLHTDATLLPAAQAARSSWNYRMSSCTQGVDAVVVSYWMNRLHALDEPVEYLVTLNGDERIDPDTVLRRMTYDHPLYTAESVAAQRRLPALNTGRTAFAGAYHGWGFHEDGCASGVRAAESLGSGW
ncbi:Predicted NAD/FAD-binding protein [Modestobacter sp. DSM 44400]|uniref:NAD(P)/FAD-dependent oxidoreductase n=1 Tax=Modestobacter sp. DSM 44400 TaxID=1550230 RepID=UPI0008977447|nr:FAD-dependent oxidoreductase [Modestobacter sp. DSM 44400]SDY10202.1 Predicted NAD/FAD-binding protein [Modestobacter sp. DSM 44400]